MLLLLGFLFSAVTFTSFAQDNLQELSNQTRWHRLAHYKKSFWGSWNSEADGPGFFFSPKGKSDPEAELRATLEALKSPFDETKADDHPLCRFPLRRDWLISQGLLNLPKNLKCPKFEQFRFVVDAEKVSMVFSSYYLNNPSSAFGHTFLRVHRKQSSQFGKKAELLDSGVNYAAATTTSNAFLYGLYGLTGVFKGYFAKLPYYYKVREYADFESRDLWSFELNLTQLQVDQMIQHLWELGQTYFDYFFLSENCSYHLITLLELLDDRWDFSSQLPSGYVIPSETVKVLARTPGLISKIEFRPSSRRVFETSFSKLNANERDAFFNSIDHSNPDDLSKDLSDETRQKVLDTAIDYWDFRRARDILIEEKSAMELKQKYLLARSQIPLVTPMRSFEAPADENPSVSHDPSVFGFFGGASQFDKGLVEIQYRSAFHNKIEWAPGSPKYTSMELLDAQIRLGLEKMRPYLQNFSLVSIESLNPVKSYHFPLSWDLKVGAERIAQKTHCKNQECFAAVARVGGGSSLELPWKFNLSLLGDYELAASDGFNKSYFRQSMGPHIIFYRPMSSRLGLSFDAKIFYHLFFKDSWSYSHSAKLIWAWSKNVDSLLQWGKDSKGHEVFAGLRYFF
ncbi:MAG: DUF4105 domain-containing protein [Proteobacteria bacterium]|nr:DUF4105 domain-containing protein [Pseudomonadota bacterium]